LVLTSLYLVAEVAGGFYFKSLALLSDAAHMLTDVAALVIALLAISLGKKAADDKRTFGYHRFEILAAAFNAVLLFVVAIYVLISAIQRFKSPEPIQSNGMMLVAVVGLLVNILSMRLLRAGQESSYNVKGAYLEVWADMIGSIGVIAAALVIGFTGKLWVDPLVAVGIGLWVLPRTWTLLKDTTNVLLEGVPSGVGLSTIRRAVSSLPGVLAVHDLHVWSTSNEDISCTAHVTLEESQDMDGRRKAIVSLLQEQFKIQHCTIQTELQSDPCNSGEQAHQ
jgi:cobalt-zinc-cadmium efflux system protein